MEWTTDHQIWYRTVYLKSDHWKQLRENKLKSSPICEKCKRRKAVDVHHLNYRQLFDVGLDDLQSLCRPCHHAEHKQKGLPKRKKITYQDYFPGPALEKIKSQGKMKPDPPPKHLRRIKPIGWRGVNFKKLFSCFVTKL